MQEQNPFDRVSAIARDSKTADRLALACRTAHDMEQVFAICRVFDRLDGRPGGSHASWLHGSILGHRDWQSLNAAAWEYHDAHVGSL